MLSNHPIRCTKTAVNRQLQSSSSSSHLATQTNDIGILSIGGPRHHGAAVGDFADYCHFQSVVVIVLLFVIVVESRCLLSLPSM